MMIRKVFFMCCLLILLSGCWDNKDINHRLMPVVLGITGEGEQYKAYLQVPKPENDGMGSQVIIEKGYTINQIVDKMSVNMESSIGLLHIKVIILDKELAEKGLSDLIAGFMRSRDISSKALMAISESSLDELFMKIPHYTAPEGSILLDYFEKNAGWEPQIALTRIWQVYRSIHSYTRDVAIPLIAMGDNTFLNHTGSAVIKNGKMVGRISNDETLLYNAFSGHSTNGKIEVLDNASVMILGNQLHINNKFENEIPYLTTAMSFKVMILETKNNPSAEKIKKEVEELLLNRLNGLVEKTQKNEADILGIGQYYRKEISRDKLKNWRSNYFMALNWNLDVNVDIQNAGNLKIPSK
ncbi:Ger(x)C family spore germination protein [Oceanobacillus picturae]|uniref:Ger(x)C family spore germination protein n=1 Tax=Oceanobacillus picturae TaxID=171693 RepID=UPI000E6A6A1F|nr:Ger(x)C family spore germination protein [Oceanobacillus picturae]RIU91271.1 Ger(x)C family spore germination protein [Oceanobacillus picturae]